MVFTPVAVYGLQVSSDGDITPAVPSFPATFRITMAAIDPSAPVNPEAEAGAIPRATLKMIREPIQGPGDEEDDSEDEDDEDYMRALLAESDSEDDEAGASDKKSKKAAALKELMESIGQGEDESDEDMEDAPKSKKGKKAVKADAEEDSEEDSDEDSEGDMEVEEFVICTLDPTKNYQQTLDITIGEDERVFFKVDGTHDIYLTGNYLIPDDQGRNTHHEVYDSEDDEEDEDYDLSPDEDELDDMEEESDDELDTLENPRITEIEDEVPALVNKKGKNKRAAEEPAETLDEIMEKSGEKLSKKQQKKLKTNEGKAAAVEAKESPKDAKSVKFAKNLEQGPTGSEAKKTEEKPKAALGPKIIQGVTIDDKKLGSGPAAQRGNRVSMRYIGKLKDGKVFDSNKKGKPFAFTLDKGEVIKGWDIGIKGMQVGGERRITIPADKGYGKSGVPGIPPNSTLIFDVKMLEIK